VICLRVLAVAAAGTATSLPAHAASQGRSGGIAFGAILLSGLVLAILLPGLRTSVASAGCAAP
jgi:hypothetical protein